MFHAFALGNMRISQTNKKTITTTYKEFLRTFIKVEPSPSKKTFFICFNDSSSKMMKMLFLSS